MELLQRLFTEKGVKVASMGVLVMAVIAYSFFYVSDNSFDLLKTVVLLVLGYFFGNADVLHKEKPKEVTVEPKDIITEIIETLRK